MSGPCLCPQSLTEHSKESVLTCSINDQISYSRYLFYIFAPFSANSTDPQLSLLATEEEGRKIEVKHCHFEGTLSIIHTWTGKLISILSFLFNRRTF